MKKITLVRRSIKPTADKLTSYSMELEVITAQDIDKHVFVNQRFHNVDGTFDDRFAAVASPTQLQDLDVNSPGPDTSYFRVSKIVLTHASLDYLNYIFDTIVTDISMLIKDDTAMEVLEEDVTVEVTGEAATTVKTDRAVYLTAGEYRTVTVPNPVASQKTLFFFTNEVITVLKLIASIVGNTSPSVTWTLRFGPDHNLSGTELKTGGFVTNNTGSGQIEATFNNPVIPAGSYVWGVVSAKTGTVTSLGITILHS